MLRHLKHFQIILLDIPDNLMPFKNIKHFDDIVILLLLNELSVKITLAEDNRYCEVLEQS